MFYRMSKNMYEYDLMRSVNLDFTTGAKNLIDKKKKRNGFQSHFVKIVICDSNPMTVIFDILRKSIYQCL